MVGTHDQTDDGSLTVEDFVSFMTEVYGGDDETWKPFQWQQDLAEHVLTEGRWPDLLDLPTGSGKTSALDIALFAIASNPGIAPRRIVFVVDRRVIVSQVASRVDTLRTALTTATHGTTVERVARRLRGAFTTEDDRDVPPLVFAELRGGVALDETWVTRPDIPAVIVSTVDQVGSRLLFRGYGVSAGMRSVHAGLLGNDTLFLLDEVHLSRPFARTLGELQREYRRSAATLGTDRWQVVEMTATPSHKVDVRFELPPADRAAGSRLAPRLHAQKLARLQRVGRAGQSPTEAIAATVPDLARSMPGTVVGVIVNRVATAVAIATELRASLTGHDEVVLITGRMRPLDRDELLTELEPRILAGRTRTDAPRLFLVATQTVEAGADFDLDALITEIAPIDALRQRFGRVDRLGHLSVAGTPAQVIIVAGHGQTVAPPKEPDPVYDNALALTWQALHELHGDGTFNVGPSSEDLPTGSELMSPNAPSPMLLQSHLDALVQTWPAPATDVPIELWLHGNQPPSPEVNLVWRADLDDDLIAAAVHANNDNPDRGRLVDLLLACPPRSSEAISLPIWAVKAWLRGSPHRMQALPVADVDQPAPSSVSDTDSSLPAHPYVVRWRGAKSTAIPADEVRPGDTIVVPHTWGGLELGNWQPNSVVPVADLGDRAQIKAGAEATLRLHPAVLAPHLGWPEGLPDPPRPPTPDLVVTRSDQRREIDAWLASVSGAPSKPWLDERLAALSSRDADGKTRWAFDIVETSPDTGVSATERMYVLRARLPKDDNQSVLELAGLPYDGDDFVNSFIGKEIELQSHLDGVGALARHMAETCGLPEAIAADLELAGRLHDLGKADRRFQCWLHDGDEVAMARHGGLLAKSTADHRSFRRRRQARERAGYPDGTRHELLSVALAVSHPDFEALANDPDLVLHLIASHHGYCRGLPPAQVRDDEPKVEVPWDGVVLRASPSHLLDRLDGGVVDRFWAVNAKYGAHGLAWLEAILRLADHRRSAQEAGRASKEPQDA